MIAVRETPVHDGPARKHKVVFVPFDAVDPLSHKIGNPGLAWQQLEFLEWIGIRDIAIRIVFRLFLSVAVVLGRTGTFLRIIRFGESGRK